MIYQELIDVEGDGMADMAFHCIQEMDIDNRMTVSLLSIQNLLVGYQLRNKVIVNKKQFPSCLKLVQFYQVKLRTGFGLCWWISDILLLFFFYVS